MNARKKLGLFMRTAYENLDSSYNVTIEQENGDTLLIFRFYTNEVHDERSIVSIIKHYLSEDEDTIFLVKLSDGSRVRKSTQEVKLRAKDLFIKYIKEHNSDQELSTTRVASNSSINIPSTLNINMPSEQRSQQTSVIQPNQNSGQLQEPNSTTPVSVARSSISSRCSKRTVNQRENLETFSKTPVMQNGITPLKRSRGRPRKPLDEKTIIPKTTNSRGRPKKSSNNKKTQNSVVYVDENSTEVEDNIDSDSTIDFSFDKADDNNDNSILTEAFQEQTNRELQESYARSLNLSRK